MTDTKSIADYYDANADGEHSRLLDNRLEFEVSLRVILKCISDLQSQYAPDQNLKILDLGGGTGRYAIELARRGHSVVLSDISISELERARTSAIQAGVHLAKIVQADAKNINQFDDLYKLDHYDLILCQGPFYHLLEVSERIKLLQSCRTMLKSPGVLIAAFVTRYAHLRDVARKDPGRLLREQQFYTQYLKSGQYTRNHLLSSYHCAINEAETLFLALEESLLDSEGAKMTVIGKFGCEGFLGGGLAAGLNHLTVDEFDPWLELTLQHAQQVADTSDHTLIVAKKDKA